MKKSICLILVMAMIATLFPATSFADALPAGATALVLNESDGRLVAESTLDHTKNITLGYDVHLSGIGSCTTPNSWPDECKISIRNTEPDHYIYFAIKSFCNGSGKYQIAVQSQVWNGSNWSQNDFVWSKDYDAPVSDLKMEINYNGKTKVYSWKLTAASDGSTVNTGTATASSLLDSIKNCTSCEIAFKNSSASIGVSNAYLIQSEVQQGGPGEEVVKTPLVFSGTGLRLVANGTGDNLQNYEVGLDINLTAISSVSTPNTWADDGFFVIRNGAKDDYVKFSVRGFCNGSGKYQLATMAQVWDGANWSKEVFCWTNEKDDPITSCHMVVNYVAKTHQYTWCIKESATGATLAGDTVPVSDITADLYSCTNCELVFDRKTNSITPGDAYIAYKEETSGDFDDTKTPGTFGWHADSEDFTNWKTTSEGTMFYVNHNGAGSKRIWKNPIEDVNNFTLTLTARVVTHRCYVEIMGVAMELDCNGGNGNQICEKFSGNYRWLDAADQEVQITVARANGGDLSIRYLGKGNPETMTFSVLPVDESKTDVIVGVYDNPGAAYFSDIIVQGLEGQNVEDFGWTTDEISGSKDFSGWTSLDGICINANYDATTGNHRIWKNLISDTDNFTARLTLEIGDNASAGIRALGKTMLFRPAGGGQLEVLIGGQSAGVIGASDKTIDIYLIRKNGGNMQLSVIGKGSGVESFEIPATEVNNNFELVSEAGICVFKNITVKRPSECRREVPFGNAVFAGDLETDWVSILTEDMEIFQNSPVKSKILSAEATAQDVLSEKAELVVLYFGREAMLSGKTAETFLSEYETYLDEIIAGLDEGSVLLIAGVPYVADATRGLTALETYAKYNAGLRALAEKKDIVFADLYSAMGGRDWTVKADGKSLSSSGTALVEGEIIERLMRECSCLAVNATATLRTSLAATEKLTAAALNAFKNADSLDKMKAAVIDKSLGLNLVFYKMLTSDIQTLICQALLSESRSEVSCFYDADLLFTKILYKVTRENPLPQYTKAISTVLTVGASCTQGTAAVNEKTDSWPVRMGNVMNLISPDTYTIINKGIAGTRMCTVTDNKMWPAAKDTVDDYIVSVNPDLLYVTYGFNDMNAGTTLEEYETTFRSYLTEVTTKCPDAVIILGSIQPTFGENNKATAPAWSAVIKKLAEEFGCIFADTYDDVCQVNWLLTDGVHPTNAGYRVMANAYLRIMNAYMDLGADKNVTGEITGADLALGSDLTLRYYAQISGITAASKVSMKFTRNEKSVEVPGIYNSETDSWTFPYTGINPQCMTDSVDAELLVDGEKLAENKGYSVKSYCDTLYASATNEALKTLIADLLTYGAEAQKLMGYKPGALANAGYETKASTFDPESVESVRSITSSTDAGKKILAAYMRLSYVNEIFLNVKCDDAKDVSLKVYLDDEFEKSIALSELVKTEGVYQVSLGALKASELTAKVKVELLDGEKVLQTLTYSVDSYVGAMAGDATFGDLIKALHNYGKSVEEYRKAE